DDCARQVRPVDCGQLYPEAFTLESMICGVTFEAHLDPIADLECLLLILAGYGKVFGALLVALFAVEKSCVSVHKIQFLVRRRFGFMPAAKERPEECLL